MRTILLILGLSGKVFASPPTWYNLPTKVVGKTVVVSCKGEGPDSALAKINALNECRMIANEFLATELRVENTSIQTEKETSFNSTVESNTKVKNLICKSTNELTEDFEDHSTHYLRCSFDLDKVETQTIANDSLPTSSKFSDLKDKKIVSIKLPQTNFSQEKRAISMSVIPNCDDILISGQRSRTIKCTSNPVNLLIYKSDQKITIRVKGHKPKSIKVTDLQVDKEEYEVQVD